ncbi:hypothetical protein CRM22_002027 [Opisthorchis felineus]|uniref:LMBR1 domain-containing protein 2 n=1 Tax=Opisthorchis felineus TaxID=147828 RepID=A0A4S2M835_OPIFE|nr:hypothetical protein CRM22_002027 [Opisthorchis felineus]
MALALLLMNIAATAVFTTTLCYYYGGWKKRHKVATLVAFISWWLPALLLTLLPVDIATTFYRSCILSNPNISLTQTSGVVEGPRCKPPLFHTDPAVFLLIWHVVYWGSQFLTWVLIPLIRSYATAGDFTALGKLKTALLDHVFYNASYFVIFMGALIYLIASRIVSFEFRYLKVLLITTGNTWGLFLVIIFFGYGLVAVPRSLWLAGNPVASLHQAYFCLSKRNMELNDEEDKLKELNLQIIEIKNRLPANHPLQPFVLTVFKQTQERKSVLGASCDPIGTPVATVDISNLSVKTLARMHRSLKATQQRCARALDLYNDAVQSALWIEDVNIARGKCFSPTFLREHSDSLNGVIQNFAPYLSTIMLRIRWYWYCYLRLWLLRVLALLLALTSLLMVWSECTFSVRSPTLSLVAGLLNAEAKQRDYLLVEVSSFLALGYLSFAVFYTVFHLRIFNYYRLVGNHHTDENSLLFCGGLACRLAPSLCLNFLGLAHLDSHLSQTTLTIPLSRIDSTAQPSTTIETTYTRFMGHLDIIPFIAKGFNVYFPILVVLLCLCTYFQLLTRLLHQMGIAELMDSPGYKLSVSGDSIVDDVIQDGRLLLRKERLLRSQARRIQSSTKVDIDKVQGISSRVARYFNEQDFSDRVHLLRDTDGVTSSRGLMNDSSGANWTNPHSDWRPVEFSESAIQNEFSLQSVKDARKSTYL